MQGHSNRFVVVISALLTLFVLATATLALGFRNGWLHVATETPSRDAEKRLEEAYRALDDAYGQIRSLQTAQPQVESRGRGDRLLAEHDGDDRERGSRRRESRHD